MSTDAELAKHIGHRTTLLDARRLRCVDCTQTVALPAPVASTARDSPRAGDPAGCERHAGEWARACRACRAERLADETRTRPPAPSSPEARAQARERVQRVLAVRGVVRTSETTTEESA